MLVFGSCVRFNDPSWKFVLPPVILSIKAQICIAKFYLEPSIIPLAPVQTWLAGLRIRRVYKCMISDPVCDRSARDWPCSRLEAC